MVKRLLFYLASVFIVIFMVTMFNKYKLNLFSETNESAALSQGSPSVDGTTATLIPPPTEAASASERDTASTGVVDQIKNKVFQKWFEHEANQLNLQDNNPVAKTAQLKSVAQAMREDEFEYLKQKSLNLAAPQVQRIFSTYMLTLGGDRAQQALVDIASQTLNRKEESSHPHSIDEALTKQEQAIQLMAIDSLYESGATIADKISQLEKVMSRSTDPTIKNYAQRKLNDLKTR